MSERPTPETDADQHEGLLRTNPIPMQVVTANFARKLERERDAAREALMKIEDLFIDGTDVCADREKMGIIARAALEVAK